MPTRRTYKTRIEDLEKRVVKTRQVHVIPYDQGPVAVERKGLLRNLPRGTRKVYLVPRNGRDPSFGT